MTTEHSIPFNKPFIVGKELHYIAQAVTLGNIAGDGRFTQRCCEILQETHDIHKVLMTPSCTAALELASMLCQLGPGDEVLVPSYTFVSTVNAFVQLGARPVFVDIRPDTLNIDPDLVESAITPKTKAILPVHYAGVGCEMDRIMTIAARHGLMVIEDAAQGIGASYRGRPLGSIGHLGTFSFHQTKNCTCGEGGALCVNMPELLARAEIIRDKGTNRQQFFRGEVDKYTWVDVGSSYVPSEICCAFLAAQLEMLESIAHHRKRSYQVYLDALKPLEDKGLMRMPYVPEDCQSNYHMFYVLLPDSKTRDGLMKYLHEQSISAVFHYVPLHTSPMGQTFGYRAGDLPVTEDVSERLLRLPLYYELSDVDQARVIGAVSDFMTGTRRPAAHPLAEITR